jgi:hypothetical protein
LLPKLGTYAKKASLEKIPYVENVPKDERVIFIHPYFDRTDKTFKLPLPQGDNVQFLRAEPAQMCYYSEEVIDSNQDIHLGIVESIARYYLYKPMANTFLGIIRDILNLSGVLEKYFINLDLLRKKGDPFIGNLVVMDLEFLFSNLRSTYDSMQSILKDLWMREKRKKLPDSYSDMAKLCDEELRRKYDLSEPLIGYYSDTSDFFFKCRKIRDGFHHYAIDVDVVFCLEDGFGLPKRNSFLPDPLTSEFDIWPEDKIKSNGLVSVLALISHLNRTLIAHTEEFSEALVQSLTPKMPIFEKSKLFLRGSYIHHLLKTEEYTAKQWIDRVGETL